MKIINRFSLSILALIALVLGILSAVQPRPVSAANGISASAIKNSYFYFTSTTNIVGEFPKGGVKINFIGQPTAANPYAVYGEQTQNGVSHFCSGGSATNPIQIELSIRNPVPNPITGTVAGGGISLRSGTTPQDCQNAWAPQKTISLQINKTAPGPTLSQIKAIQNSNLSFTDGAHIVLSGLPDLAGNKSITFTDGKPFDAHPTFSAASKEFCGGGDIKLEPSVPPTNSQYLASSTIKATINIGYYDTSQPNVNNQYPCNTSFVITRSISNPAQIATRIFTWDTSSDQIDSITGGLTLKPKNGTSTVYLQDPSNSCGGGWEVNLASAGANSGTLIANPSFPDCKTTPTQNRGIKISGNQFTTGGGGGGSGTVGNDCETQAATTGIAGHALAFVACPMLEAAQSFSDWLIGQVEGLLSFTFANNLGNAQQTSNVQHAWANIRDLSSVVLVIIMLVMVLSQAISWGPFDAYTVRKILPRLVIAVLLMQLSWTLIEWVVKVFDDLGHGIANLIYQPFGGPSNLQLAGILSKAGIQAYAGGSVVLVSLIGIAAIAVLSLPTILLVGWSIVMALIVAWITLAVRQIFLIAAIIFSPLAFLLWILPGTQKYWKMWSDNFIKLLLMFPLIIGMIAIGRVFALITSSGSNDELVKFILIMIGYFGTFFFIPKTFKWGGQLMAAANGALQNVAPKLGGPVTNYLKGQQARSRWHLSRERRQEQLMRRAQAGWAEGMNAEGVRGRINRARGAGLRSIYGSRADREIRNRIRLGAQAKARAELEAQGKEAVQPLVEEGRFGGPVDPLTGKPSLFDQEGRMTVAGMAANGTDNEQEAAFEALVNGRKWAELDAATQTERGRAGLQRTLNKNGALVGTISEGRSDLAPWNVSRPIMATVTGSDGGEGMTAGQLITQHKTFWSRVAQESTTATPDELQKTYDRLKLMSRDPRAGQMIGGPVEANINEFLKTFNTRVGGGAANLGALVDEGRIMPTSPPTP